jgi:hypothetical protein
VSIDPRDDRDVVHRALRRLPQPRAPRSLAPRVMAAIAADARPARHTARPWLSWPMEWRLASLVAFLLAGGAVAWFWPGLEAAGWTIVSRGLAAIEVRAAAVSPGLGALTRLVVIGWETFVQPLLWIALVWIVMMTAACAAFATALERVALGETSQ